MTQPVSVRSAAIATARPRDERPPSRVSEDEVRAYGFLVRSIAAKLARKVPSHVQRDDLLAAGTLGLHDALRKNPKDRGPGFRFYVHIRIQGAILDELRNEDWLTRRGRSRARAEHPDRSARASVLTLDELAKTEPTKLREQSIPSPHEVAEMRQDWQQLATALAELVPRERAVLTLHYYEELKLQDIATRLGVSASRVSQLHARAVANLQRRLVESNPDTAVR